MARKLESDPKIVETGQPGLFFFRSTSASARRRPRQSPLDLSEDHLDGDRVVSAARDDHVGVALAGLDELKMHRLHCRQVLIEHLFERTPAASRVALDSPDEPDVR